MKIKGPDLRLIGPAYFAEMNDEAYADGCATWGREAFMAIVAETLESECDWDTAKRLDPSDPAHEYRRLKAMRYGRVVDD